MDGAHAPIARSPRVLLPSAAIALVWFYEGAWCKILPGRADHRAIVVDLPLVSEPLVIPNLVGIGPVEVALGLWVLSGWRPYLAATTQTLLPALFSLGGLAFSFATIDEPGRMLTATFTLVHWSGAWPTPSHDRGVTPMGPGAPSIGGWAAAPPPSPRLHLTAAPE
ncbi:DoxX-like family protein [Salinactinospora qingdaonensis]|uniref:DoxX-like family protein n=1 Tax=Salinactinospora qingdaonensis TaxID=702744 RepID=A0ABP7GE29_9ACTN